MIFLGGAYYDIHNMQGCRLFRSITMLDHSTMKRATCRWMEYSTNDTLLLMNKKEHRFNQMLCDDQRHWYYRTKHEGTAPQLVSSKAHERFEAITNHSSKTPQ